MTYMTADLFILKVSTYLTRVSHAYNIRTVNIANSGSKNEFFLVTKF